MTDGGKFSALVLSLIIHAAIAAGFLVTLRFTAPVQPSSPGEVIQATAIDVEALDAREAAKEAARLAELRRQREAAERAAAEQREREAAARQAELQRQEEARQRAEAEVRRQREAAEAKRQAEAEAARRKAEAERQRQAAEAAKRKAEAEAAAREEREGQLLRSLEAEEQRLAAIRSGKLAQYQSLITGKVMRSWLPPPNLAENFYCAFEVRQIPGGEVVSVKAGRCDNEVLRRSAEAAIWKASPLPPPPEPSLFDQYINIEFTPEDR